jgi:hypothetical protein
VTGQCLCGAIHFEAQEIPGVVYNCHCTRCRISHGAAFATQAFAVRSTLKFHSGRELLKEYESTGGIRAFCSQCGSRLMNYAKNDGDYLSIAVACLDESYRGAPVADAFLDFKAQWHEPSGKIPGFGGYPSGANAAE